MQERLDIGMTGRNLRRVCVVGAESTGTTTMARALAEHYRTAWVPEVGRSYWEGRLTAGPEAPWRTEELLFVAEQQCRMEEALARIADRILVCDTDAFATRLWHERYMGFLAPELKDVGADLPRDLYLLTDADFPFVQDGTRDGEHVRDRMHARFLEELPRLGVPWLLLSGGHERRFSAAVAACDRILAMEGPAAGHD